MDRRRYWAWNCNWHEVGVMTTKTPAQLMRKRFLWYAVLAIEAIYDARNKKKPALALFVSALVIGSTEAFK